MIRYITLFVLMMGFLGAHEGHHQSEIIAETTETLTDKPTLTPLESKLNAIGSFHLVILHFPIALVMMTVIAELLFGWTKNPLYDNAAYFMIIAAALTAPITALFGWALSLGQVYTGLSYDFFLWHRYFGVVTALLAPLTAYLRYTSDKSLKAYYISLFFLFLSVSLTGAFGGSLAFG